MKTFKLILKSLISNNACIDGGRKKPWYFAAIMFFLSMIFSIVPMFVQTMTSKGDDPFKTYSYGADVAMLRFNEYLEDNDIKMYVKTAADGKKFISCEKDNVSQDVSYTHLIPGKNENNEPIEVPDFYFFYRNEYNFDLIKPIIGEESVNMVYISENCVYLTIPNHKISITCTEATKYLDEGTSINALLSTNEDSGAKLNETFNNWKLFIRNAHNHARLTIVWQTCLIFGGINIFVTLLMGFLIWILTRGKNNPYRLFNLWETQKMSWWSTISPAILALGLGFLLKNFTKFLFPMLLAVRIMWLSMRSLRPDGSGYAQAD